MVSEFCPRAVKRTLPPSFATSSTRVPGRLPPPRRKAAHGCVTLNGALLSVPVGWSSNFS